LATPLRKKDQVAKIVLSDLNQMGAQCELDINNIVTASLEDLSLWRNNRSSRRYKSTCKYNSSLVSRKIDPARWQD
jgi:hypothetical protein